MRTDDFSFELPDHLIARHPLVKRDASRLLDLSSGIPEDKMIADLPGLAQAGDVWVFNDTKVIPSRLLGKKASGGKVEILLLESLSVDNWLAWGKASKPLKPGDRIQISEDFSIRVESRRQKGLVVTLLAEDTWGAIEKYGHMPLPPYIDRPDTVEDRVRYQTIYARSPGAVAAPTAGLHFTPEILDALDAKGVIRSSITLHVGPGTFQPVQSTYVDDHVMHRECYEISQQSADVINAAIQDGRRVVAVGTTSLRTLEAACQNGVIQEGRSQTDIFIRPGYSFKAVNSLLTNFHLPQSTLLMLVCAMVGTENILSAYQHAIEKRYRFYSYGDAMFLPKI